MGTIDYYHRYDPEGNCETICTRCFAALGRTNEPAQLKLIEDTHVCSTQSKRLTPKPPGKNQVERSIKSIESSDESIESTAHLDRLRHFLGKMDPANILLSLVSIFVCLYVLPSVIEIEMMKHMSTASLCIVFGDLAGCSFLSLGLGLKKTGALLYALLTGCEGWLYAARIVPPHVLVWLLDIGPTLMVAGLIAFFAVSSSSMDSMEQ